MQVWDYQLPKAWQPKTDKEWVWFLVRKLNYGDFKGLRKTVIKNYFPKIKTYLDPGMQAMLEDYLIHETH